MEIRDMGKLKLILWMVIAFHLAACIPQSNNLPDSTSVEIRPLVVNPANVVISAGMADVFQIGLITEWNETFGSIHWAVEGLPENGSAEFQTGIRPSEGPVLIRTSQLTPEGIYPLTIIAEAGGITWTSNVQLEITPCIEKVDTGDLFTDTSIQHRMSGPGSASYGNRSNLLIFCGNPAARYLDIAVRSATTDTGNIRLSPPAAFRLYRLLRQIPDMDDLKEGYPPTVELAATSDNGLMSWHIQPGAYLLFFPRFQFIEDQNRTGQTPVSITYSLQITFDND